ncbi:MAG: sigma-54-dependent Fis family transcriptional regulator [Desulfobacteraceae bacterium]|nr:sigma-54-dependent Fis family transcriptional regulator [Desulfobacteraceae bacterium]
MTKILVVDDDKDQLKILSGFLKKKGFDPVTAQNGVKALEEFKKNSFSILLTDLKMPEMDGEKLISEINRINPIVKKIMITAYADVETTVNVMKAGADDLIEKPVNLEKLLEKLKKLESEYFMDEESEAIMSEIEIQNLPVKIIGKSTEIKEAILRAGRVASKNWTVLLKGETGTGKELFAKLIHLLSDRKDFSFVEINCGAIPENLFESELFGHAKGAFTGADKDKKGLVEIADKGTLFLDEIGEMPLLMQAKLLRFLQEGKFQKVGDTETRYSDVRIIAATNRDLTAMIKENLFREDLFYRLSVLDIEIPPLRQRKEDIHLLTDFFLKKYGQSNFSFDDEALNSLIKYNFKGNVRELEHIVQKAIAFSRTNIISKQDLPPEVRFFREDDSSILKEKVSVLEKEMIITALEKNGWNQTKAAKSLGISERVLRYKMQGYSISKD